MTLDIASDSREFMADDLIGDERFAKGVSLTCVVEGLGETGSRFAVAADGHDETFFVKISHDDAEAFVFFAEEVLNRYVYIIEFDKTGASAFLAAVGYAAVREALCVCWDDNDGNALCTRAAGAYSCGHVCCPWHSGNPFLVPIHDVEFAIWSLLGGSL